MVDLTKANAAMQEKASLTAALDALSKGGRIVAMVIEVPPPSADIPGPGASVMVSTQGVDYPAQMVSTIQATFTARRDALAKQLSDMGVETPTPPAVGQRTGAQSQVPPPPPAR